MSFDFVLVHQFCLSRKKLSKRKNCGGNANMHNPDIRHEGHSNIEVLGRRRCRKPTAGNVFSALSAIAGSDKAAPKSRSMQRSQKLT